MRAVTISIGKFHIVLAVGRADTIQLTVAKDIHVQRADNSLNRATK